MQSWSSQAEAGTLTLVYSRWMWVRTAKNYKVYEMPYCLTPGSRGPEQGPAEPTARSGGSTAALARAPRRSETWGGGGSPRVAEVNLGKQQSQLLCSWTWTEDKYFLGSACWIPVWQGRICLIHREAANIWLQMDSQKAHMDTQGNIRSNYLRLIQMHLAYKVQINLMVAANIQRKKKRKQYVQLGN
jgi:hypothetical protein